MKNRIRGWWVVGVVVAAMSFSAAAKPNVVIIFLDDSGWADVKPFGNPKYPTPKP